MLKYCVVLAYDLTGNARDHQDDKKISEISRDWPLYTLRKDQSFDSKKQRMQKNLQYVCGIINFNIILMQEKKCCGSELIYFEVIL